MKEDFGKPKYKDYKKTIILTSQSSDKQYELADISFVIAGAVLCLLASMVIASYLPISSFASLGVCLAGVFFYIVYTKFVHRFGRFHVKWRDWTEHPGEEQASENCDRWGDFLDTEENRKSAKRTHRAFLVFYAAVIAVTFLFCFLGYGLSYARLYGWHRAEIEEAAQIAQKYDSLFVHPWNNGANIQGKASDESNIGEQDSARLKQIMGSLQWDYVSHMGLGSPYGEIPNKFIMSLRGGFSWSYLVRYDEAAGIEQVQNDYPKEMVTQLDEHWWYVR